MTPLPTSLPRKSSFNPPTRRFLNKQIKNSQSANTIGRVTPPRGLNNELSEKGGFISRTSNGALIFLRGHYPGRWGSRRVGRWQIVGAPYVTGKIFCTERAGRGRVGGARSEFRHVYITAQDISQSWAKLPKFPGSGVLKRGTSIHFFTPTRTHTHTPPPLRCSAALGSKP